MGLTILSIPLLALGIFLKPYSLDNSRCFNVSFTRSQPYCFAQDSRMPEIVKYGSVLAGFVLLYAGRLQIKRQRGK
jgi:hypothetical protein